MSGFSLPYSNLIARLSQLHPKRIDLGLERMQRLLQRLDHPERKLPPVIHVAGTNGKGSTVAYLRAREQVTTVYLETLRRIELEDKARRQVQALCFIVDRSHVQYAGRLSLHERVHLVRQGHGRSGANRDYVIETVQALEALGYRETDLHLLAARLLSTHQGEAIPVADHD